MSNTLGLPGFLGRFASFRIIFLYVSLFKAPLVLHLCYKGNTQLAGNSVREYLFIPPRGVRREPAAELLHFRIWQDVSPLRKPAEKTVSNFAMAAAGSSPASIRRATTFP